MTEFLFEFVGYPWMEAANFPVFLERTKMLARFANVCFVSIISLTLSLSAICPAGEPPVKFDVPALVGVKEAIYADSSVPRGNEKIIQVVIPVSSEASSRDRGNVDEFRFDIFWNRNVYPIADYSPKTRTTSEIEGLISVEKSKDNNSGIGINLNSGYQDLLTGSAKADLSQRTGSKLRYQEVPQHEVLVASGTVQRGTGAFFRFHPSKRETLEGGRDLMVAYRVPVNWRGGLLKIECRANGSRKVIGAWRDPIEESRSFIVPIYLEGDDQARDAAVNFVRSEQNLRMNWDQHVRQQSKPTGLFGLGAPQSNLNRVPDQWMHYLIQSGSDDYLEKYRPRLTFGLATAADEFVAARQGLLRFSR